jgi:hypothetical protein
MKDRNRVIGFMFTLRGVLPFLTVTDHTKYSIRCTRYNIM